jgi:hypothetical protein
MKLKTTLPWVEIKKRLKEKSDRELLSIISSCYKASDEVKFYLTSIVADDDDANEILIELKERLSQAFLATAKSGQPLGPNLKEARKIISDVKKLTNKPETIINFVLDYVEHGVEFTNKYGDMWDGYYSSIESMFESLENYLIKNVDKINVAVTMNRIENIVNKSNGIGWGFHDNLLDMYLGLKCTINELKK